MIRALELLKAAKAAERAQALCARAMERHEGVMPPRDALKLLAAASRLRDAATNLLLIKPKAK